MHTDELHICGHCGARCDYPLVATWNGIYICDVCARQRDALVDAIRRRAREERERKG